MTKVCLDCGEDRHLDDYHYSDKKNGIKKSYCRDCSYKRAQQHIAQDHLAWKAYMKRHYRENPEMYPGNHKSKKIPPRCGVYIIDCLLTDDAYIGCSSNLRNRRYRHSRNVGQGNKPLKQLINELGWQAFTFDVLEECDKEVMFDRETHWIKKLNPSLNVAKK